MSGLWFEDRLRRYLERKGYALLPWAQFAEMTADRQRLVDEIDRMQRADRLAADERQKLADQADVLQNSLRAQEQELDRWRTTCVLRGAERVGEAAGLPDTAPQRDEVEARLLDRLVREGVPVAAGDSVFLHVGFAHSGTTSLQLNFFARRPDLLYLGTPYGEAGGLFSNLKYLDDVLLSERQMLDWCRDAVYGHPRRAGRPIVVSDETLCDASEIFYSPRHLPGDMVAARLKRYFPTAKVLLTIRNQADYISSLYFNLKRNYAFLSGVALPEFRDWWAGMHTQVRCAYLQNLDYSRLIDVYARLFGRENLLVLPLERIRTHGTRNYLERVCEFLGIELRESDLESFSTPRNERMTVVESRLAELITAGAAEWAAAARSLLEKESLAELVSNAPRLAVTFDEDQRREIERVAAPGNRRLAAEFNLPLAEMGYLL